MCMCVCFCPTQERVDIAHPGEDIQCVVLLCAQVSNVGRTVSCLNVQIWQTEQKIRHQDRL